MFARFHKSPYSTLFAPAMFMLAGLIMLRFIAADIAQADAMARGIAGPISWPRFAIYGIILCGAGWFMQNLFQARRECRLAHDPIPTPEVCPVSSSSVPHEEYSALLVWIGIVLTLAYGFLLPVVGFPLATAAYIVLWLLLGGIRKPLQIGLIAGIGTVSMLYLFVKLALMPLDRGHGVFAEITIAIYRFLTIY